MSQTSEFDLLMIGVDDTTSKAIQPHIEGLRTRVMTTPSDVEELLEGIQLAPGTYAFVSTGIKEMSQFEIGQALSSSYPGVNLVFITHDRAAFELTNLRKNGFTEIFLLPLDNARLTTLLQKLKLTKSGGAFKKYKAVKLMDIKANQQLPFEVSTFLPLNNKYVKLTADGKLSEKKSQQLKAKNINSVFIDTEQIDAFYEFAAEQMLNLGLAGNDAISQTEKEEMFQSNVRELFRSFLDVSASAGDFDQGRDLLEQSKKVVESYVVKKTGIDLRAKFRELIGANGDSYSHAQSVSTIASLLSMATGIGQPEELAIAGLFHDIGMQGTRDDVSIFDLASLDGDERTAFMNHPKTSLAILREKRVTLVPIIAEILEKHHERIDGRGFPAQLPAHKIPAEAQLLSYADAFEHLSRPKPGVQMLTPAQIHAKISQEIGLSLDVLQKIERFVISAGPAQAESEALPVAAGEVPPVEMPASSRPADVDATSLNPKAG